MTRLHSTHVAATASRQQREAAYYNQYAHLNAVTDVDFTPAISDELRPFSPYWSICRLVRDAYTDSSQRLLDFGCGMGAASVTFATVGYQVEGIDISQGNLDVAKSLAEKHDLDQRCHFSVMAGEKLDFSDGHFDVVVGIDILHHVDVTAVLGEIHRVLKPGGVAIFKEPLGDNPLDCFRASALMKKLRPRVSSLDRDVHVTEDERKLSRSEIGRIHSTFGKVKQRRFSLLQRLYRLHPKRWHSLFWKLQRLDYQLLRFCPPLQRLGDVGIFHCRKPPVPPKVY